MTDVAVNEPVNAARPETKEQRSWYWYDWANSAYVTTTATVLMGPYLTAIAKERCPGIAEGVACTTNLSFLGIPIAPGSLYAYTVTVSTIVSAIFLIFVGAIADRSRTRRLFAGFAWTGAIAASAMFFIAGTNWQLGIVLILIASMCLGASLVIYDSILIRIANENERDRVSSKGWAMGYLGGGILLALNFGLLSFHERSASPREACASACCPPVGGAPSRSSPTWACATSPVPSRPPVDRKAGVVGGSLTQLARPSASCATTRRRCCSCSPTSSSTTASRPSSATPASTGRKLGFDQSTVLGVFLFVQFVAFFGARSFGAVAARIGAWRTVLYGIGLWTSSSSSRSSSPPRPCLFSSSRCSSASSSAARRPCPGSLYSQLIPAGVRPSSSASTRPWSVGRAGSAR